MTVMFNVDQVVTEVHVTDITGAPAFTGRYYSKPIIPDSATITYHSPRPPFRPEGQVSVKVSGGQVKKDGTAGQSRTKMDLWRPDDWPDWLAQLIEDVRPATHPATDKEN